MKLTDANRPVKVSQMSIEVVSNHQKDSLKYSRRGSLLIDDQAMVFNRRRDSRISNISKLSRRKSESNIEVPKLDMPISDTAFELDEVSYV